MITLVALTGFAGMPGASAFGSALPCASRDTSAAFSRWLDPAQYFLGSNGGFEQGSDDWSLSGGAAVVGGNEPFQLAGAGDANHLSLPAGGSAESRTACVAMGEPTIRLVVDAPEAVGSWLSVDATVYNPATGLSLTTHYVVLGGLAPSAWAPTPEIVIPNLVGGILEEDLTVRISAHGTPATWGVDDVYVDPFKQR